MGKEAHITIPVLTGALETPRLTPIPLGKKEVEKKKKERKRGVYFGRPRSYLSSFENPIM